MGRRGIDNPAKRSWWLVHVEAHRKSGLTVTKYCAVHGLCRNKFGEWRRALTDWEERKSQRNLARKRLYQPISMDRRRQATQAYWAMHVEAWQWSGLTLREYSSALNLSSHSLKRWRNLIESEEVEIDWRALLHPSARPRLSTKISPRTNGGEPADGLTSAADGEAQRPPRRTFTTEQKRAILLEADQPGQTISSISRAHGIATSILFRWRDQLGMAKKQPVILPVRIADGRDRNAAGPPSLLADLLPKPAGMIEVELADGRLVFAPEGSDAQAVQRAVAAREQQP